MVACLGHRGGLWCHRPGRVAAAAQAAQTFGSAAGAWCRPCHRPARHPGPDVGTPDVDARIQMALAPWYHRGDAASPIPVRAEAVSQNQRQLILWTATHAADAAAMIGTAV